MKINSRRRSNIFFKPIRISRSSHSTATIKLRFSSFHSLSPSPLRGAADFRFSRKPVPSSFEEKEEEEAKSVSARGEQTSEDKVRARPASTIFTLDTQIYLAPILNLDLRSSSSLKASVIYFSIDSRNFILGEKNSVFMYFLDVYFVQASLSRFFFFFVRKERRNRR